MDNKYMTIKIRVRRIFYIMHSYLNTLEIVLPFVLIKDNVCNNKLVLMNVRYYTI